MKRRLTVGLLMICEKDAPLVGWTRGAGGQALGSLQRV